MECTNSLGLIASSLNTYIVNYQVVNLTVSTENVFCDVSLIRVYLTKSKLKLVPL